MGDVTAWESAALVDTLRFRLVAATVVARTDVRVAATVSALVGAGDRDQASLERRVDELLQRFIAARWTVASTERSQDPSGYERVRLKVGARVPLAEDYNLAERARVASREGLTILEPAVDYRLPSAVLDAETMKLQQRIAEQALERAARFSQLTARTWRIGDIEFGVDRNLAQDYSPKFTRRENAMEAGGSAGELLMTAERLMLVAQVVLKSAP